MDTQQALKVLQTLLDGKNPDTGALLPPDSIIHSPSVIRALARFVLTLEHSEGEKQERQRKLPQNAGSAWTREEDTQLCDELAKGLPFAEIAKSHGRSNGAIWSRAVRLGKISPNSAPANWPPKKIA